MIWIFGDSFSVPFETHIDNKAAWAIDYCNYKKKIPKIFANVLSDLLKIKVTNLAIPGCDNYTMFHSYIKNIENIKKDDIVIMGWSEVTRFRLANKLNTWTSMVSNFDNNLLYMENISNQTIMEICVNRLSDVYISEINIWINFIKKTIKNFKVINWSTFNQGKIDGIFVKEIEQITNETNGIIKDAHFSEKGQKQLSEILLSKINGNYIKLL